MPSRTNDRSAVQSLLSSLRDAVSTRLVTMTVLGVLAGYSIAILGEDAVALPVLGETSGLVVGAVGLLVSAAVYTQVGGCENCASGDCNCTDSCSVDP